MTSSIWPTENQLNGLFGGSLSQNVVSELFKQLSYVLVLCIYLFFSSSYLMGLLRIYIIVSSVMGLLDSWLQLSGFLLLYMFLCLF